MSALITPQFAAGEIRLGYEVVFGLGEERNVSKIKQTQPFALIFLFYKMHPFSWENISEYYLQNNN
jgi:hypothetical protein